MIGGRWGWNCQGCAEEVYRELDACYGICLRVLGDGWVDSMTLGRLSRDDWLA